MMSPYAPRSLAAAVQILAYPVDSSPGGLSAGPAISAIAPAQTRCEIPADAGRIWILVCYSDSTQGVTVCPSTYSRTNGISAAGGETHVLIHAASYPGLVGLEWAVRASAAAAVTVLCGTSTLPREG